MNISKDEFDDLVIQAAESLMKDLPENLRQQAETILIVTEEKPVHGKTNDDENLLGLYEGIPLTERHMTDTILPDRITVYRLPHIDECRSRTKLKREIRITLLHELGHFFGFDEKHLQDLGLD